MHHMLYGIDIQMWHLTFEGLFKKILIFAYWLISTQKNLTWDTEVYIFNMRFHRFSSIILLLQIVAAWIELQQSHAAQLWFRYRIRQNFRGGKLSRFCTKHTIHWKAFAVHQAHAIMYCTRQMIQGENFRDWLKNRENRESFPPRKFCRIRYFLCMYSYAVMLADHPR